MNAFFLLAFLGGLALVNLLASVWPSKRAVSPRLACVRRRFLLSPVEVRYLGLLDRAVGENRRVHSRVPLSLLIAPSSRSSTNPLSELSVDFAIFTRDGTEPLCAVLLDSERKQPRRLRKARARVRALCNKAGLPVLSVPADSTETPEVLGRRIDELIWPIEQPLVAASEIQSDDEDALLAGLAVAARDRSAPGRTYERKGTRGGKS